jgi:carboxyl-terminal processing protease
VSTDTAKPQRDRPGGSRPLGPRPPVSALRSGRARRAVYALALALGVVVGAVSLLGAQDDLRSQLDLFGVVLYEIQTQYAEPVDNKDLVEGAVRGLLETLDPHSVYLPKERYARFTEQFRENYSGIGIQFEVRRGELIVISPLEGTPAFRLGMRAGDRIVKVDDKPVPATVSNEEVFRLLRGPEGSSVKVEVRRGTQSDPIVFDLVRARIPQESVRYAHLIRPGVGYVRVVRFASATGLELDRALEKLKAQGMKQLLVDLRFNSGGLLHQAVEVSNLLLPSGQRVVYTRGRLRSASADYYTDDRNAKYTDLPLVVLIDHGSASASEIFAGAVQDLDRGLVVGTTSFGKGLVQNQMQLSDGSAVLLTVAKYYTPTGRLIQRDYSDRESYQADAWKEDAAPESVLATRPKFTTPGGRTVYGGGGITPDVVVPSQRMSAHQVEIEQAGALFEAATKLGPPLRGKYARFEDFLKEYRPDEAALGLLRGELERDSVRLADSVWTGEREYVARRLKAEIAGNLFGLDARYRVDITGDRQLQRALELFPDAAKLLSSAGPSPRKPGKVPAEEGTTAGPR